MTMRAPSPQEIELARATIQGAGGQMAPPPAQPGFIPEAQPDQGAALAQQFYGAPNPLGVALQPPPQQPPPTDAFRAFLEQEGGYAPKEATAIVAAPPQARAAEPLPPPGFSRPVARSNGRPAPSKLDRYLRDQYAPPKEPLGVPMTGEERSTQVQLDEAQLENAQDMFDAQEASRAAMVDAQQRQLAAQEAADLAAQERERQRLAHLQSMEAKFAELSNSVANEPIDSGRLWNSQSTGDKILAYIALGLAGGAVGGAEGAKWATDQLGVAIQRDIDEQKANKALQQSKLAAEESLIGMARQRFASEAEQDAAMREIMYRRAGVELERSAEFAQRPERQAAFNAMRDGIEQGMLNAQQERRLQSDQYELRRRALLAAASARPDPRKQRIASLKLDLEEKQLRGQLSGDAPPLDPKTAAKQAAKTDADIRAADAAYDAAVSSAENYRTKAKAYELTDRKKAHAARQAWDTAATAYQAEYLGKSDSDRQVAEAKFPEPGVTTTDEEIDAAANALVREAEAKRRERHAAAGRPLPARPKGKAAD